MPAFFRPVTLLALALGSAAATPALACSTTRTYSFNVTERIGNVVFQTEPGVRNTAPVSFRAELVADAALVADLRASIAGGCTQTVTHYSYGSAFNWTNAMGGYDAVVELFAQRANRPQRRLKRWPDNFSLGPGGDQSESRTHLHQISWTAPRALSVDVGDGLFLYGSGEVWAVKLDGSVFSQSYGNYGYGLAFDLPTLDIVVP